MTTTDIAVPGAALAIRPGQDFWTDKQRAALAVLGIKDAGNGDLAVFMHYCQKTGLDPFSRQIYMIARREKQGEQWVTKQTIQIGIDGFRVIRDRAARRLGISVEYEDTIWYDADGREHKVWLRDEPPAACRVVVIKDGRRFPAVLRTASYMAMKDGKPVSQWRTQPDHMIEKCAEAYALRRAFPHDLGGLYVEDEMPPPETVQVRSERVTAADIIGEPSAPAETSSNEGAKQEAADAPHRGHAGKPALDKLTALFEQLQLDETEQETVIGWLAGGSEWTASTTQVKNVAGPLADFLKTAGGDVSEARTAIWEQYRKVHPEAGE
jgi:phage recombination protein Bet